MVVCARVPPSRGYKPPMRTALRIGLGVVVVLVVLALVIFSRGSYERIAVGAGSSGNDSAAAATCLSHPPRRDRRVIARCVRVHGILLYVRRGYDAESRVDEIHLLVSAHFHLYVVKLHMPFPAHLRVGHGLTAIGPLLETSPPRFGIHEVEAFSFTN